MSEKNGFLDFVFKWLFRRKVWVDVSKRHVTWEFPVCDLDLFFRDKSYASDAPYEGRLVWEVRQGCLVTGLQRVERVFSPVCFGEKVSPMIEAENDCFSCIFFRECGQATESQVDDKVCSSSGVEEALVIIAEELLGWEFLPGGDDVGARIKRNNSEERRAVFSELFVAVTGEEPEVHHYSQVVEMMRGLVKK